MKYSIDNARKYLGAAHEIKQGSTKFFRETREPVLREIRKATTDPYLNDAGRKKKAEEIQEKFAVEMIEKLHLRKQQYVAELMKARKIADKIVYTQPGKPDAETLDRFERAFKQLKTEIMLTRTSQQAEQKLSQFISNYDDPFIAQRIKDDFGDIAPHIISSSHDAESTRVALGKQFEKLTNKIESDEVREARMILESAEDSLKNPKLFPDRIGKEPTVVETASIEVFGQEYAKYVNNTDKFYEDYDGLVPPTHNDPELEEERQQEEEAQESSESYSEFDRIYANTRKILEEKLGGVE